MNNKAFIRVFTFIATSALAFYVLANLGTFAVDKLVFPEREFGDNTRIGTLDVSNVTESEAKVALEQHLAGWQSGTKLQVVYQDAVADYPMDAAQVLLDESIHTAETGERNSLDVSVSEEATATFLAQNFPVLSFTDEEVTAINSVLAEALGSGKHRVSISTDEAGFPRELVAETAFPSVSGEAAELAKAIDGMEIAPLGSFSLLEVVENGNFATIGDEAFTEVASALYNLVLKTNFIVEQRSIGADVPDNIPLGFEAAIDRELGIDFVFTNPNDSSFTLNATQSGGSLYVTLTGYPLVYTYKAAAGKPETVEPRIIKEYSAFVTYGKHVKNTGEDGLRIDVTRIVIDSEGNEIETSVISTDFYLPEHIVEVYPLKAADSGTAVTNPDGTVTDGTTDTTDTTDTDNDGIPDSQETDQDDDPEQPVGKDGEPIDDEDQDPQYDKAGNLVQQGK
ncbi:VanW family protein [Indiicoccus explosivorum]|uniref:VanW family protein n=1 Tax=Indiicoccus explosivorum TaxID=1917864 RepID=UPI000B43A013|nr:VanW family protein [Indiicoccus explosivorum]